MVTQDLRQAERTHMVESQIRPNQVSDARLLHAMRTLPREEFAPAGTLPYSDADLPLGGGRYLPAPMLIAKLLQLVLDANPRRVLVIGAGSGYGAALLWLCNIEVTALDDDTARDTDALSHYAPAVTKAAGPLAAGWPRAAPYDIILIEGAVLDIPPALAAQLSPGGRVIAIIADRTQRTLLGQAVIAEPSGGGFAVSAMFDCTARLLPAFKPAPEFVF